jgi:hypothetical protein
MILKNRNVSAKVSKIYKRYGKICKRRNIQIEFWFKNLFLHEMDNKT